MSDDEIPGSNEPPSIGMVTGSTSSAAATSATGGGRQCIATDFIFWMNYFQAHANDSLFLLAARQ